MVLGYSDKYQTNEKKKCHLSEGVSRLAGKPTWAVVLPLPSLSVFSVSQIILGEIEPWLGEKMDGLLTLLRFWGQHPNL